MCMLHVHVHVELTTPDSHFALTGPSSLLLNAATLPAHMDGVHGGESAQEGCARPGSPPAPLRARGGDRAGPGKGVAVYPLTSL